ncbi:MAG: reverse transcriptase domain-containing protein, partial [bacterium]
MCYWLLTQSGTPIARTTVQAISENELMTDIVKDKIKRFDNAIHLKIGGEFDRNEIANLLAHEPRGMQSDREGQIDDNAPLEPDAEMPKADDFDTEAYDKYISAQVLLPKGDGLVSCRVLNRKRDHDGHPVGQHNSNPILDSRVYNVEFPDGNVQEYAANVVAESLYAQVDDEGNQYMIMQEIIDHKKDGTAVSKDDMWILSANGNKRKRTTIKGWTLTILWKDGSTTSEPLRNLKESNPVEVAEYAVANKIADGPAFAWWINDVIRKRDRIISKIRSRYWKRTHKFGIQVPRNVDEALQIDKETGTDLWYKAIQKEMKNVVPAFQFVEKNERVPIGYKWIPCHMVFDVKMDFTRKARLVAGGHVTDPPATITYSSVVSRDSVRIAFLIAALNDLDVLAADIGNAYLNASTKEKVYTTAGKEFGSKEGFSVLIVRALYGLKSSGAAWRAHLAQTLRDMGYIPCLADPDVWMRKCTKPDGFKYYEYLLVYVDDILCVSHKPQETMAVLGKLYRLKDDSVQAPQRYLGATLKQWRFPEDAQKVRWGLSSEQYVNNAIKNVENELRKVDLKLPTKANTPMTSGYRPELDVSQLLDDEQANYFQNLIGVLRWAVELGRIDIHIDIAMLSSFLVQPRIGHLDQVFHVFAYLKSHKRSTMVFDDTKANISESKFV